MPELYRHITWAALSDQGRKRRNNEDAYGVFDLQGVCCVADGMGGGDEGEVASRAAVDHVGNALLRQGDKPLAAEAKCVLIDGAANEASRWIYKRAEARHGKGSGTTLVALCFDAGAPGRAWALHAGDSRLYRLRKNEFVQITRDHSAANLAGVRDERELGTVFRGVIMRAVGVKPEVELERTGIEVKAGDLLLLCTDGLTRMLPDAEIRNILQGKPVPQEAAAALVAAANEKGGVDNITVVLSRVGALPEPVGTVTPECGEDPRTRDSATQTPSGATPASQDSNSGPPVFAADADEVLEASEPKTSVAAMTSPSALRPPARVSADTPVVRPVARRSRRMLLAAAAGCVAVAAGIVVMMRPATPGVRLQTVAFQMREPPPEGLVAVVAYRAAAAEGQSWCSTAGESVALPPGGYEAQVTVPDYEPLRASFTVGAGSPVRVAFDMRQLRPGASLARLIAVTNDAAGGHWDRVDAYFGGDPGQTLTADPHVRVYRELISQWRSHSAPLRSGCAVRLANADRVANPPASLAGAGVASSLPAGPVHFERSGEIVIPLRRADYQPAELTVQVAAGQTGTVDLAAVAWVPGAPLAALFDAEAAVQSNRWPEAWKALERIANVGVFAWDGHRARYRVLVQRMEQQPKAPTGCSVHFASAGTVTEPPVVLMRGAGAGTEMPVSEPVRFEHAGTIVLSLQRADYLTVKQTLDVAAGQTGTVDLATVVWTPAPALSELMAAGAAVQSKQWLEARKALAMIAGEKAFAWHGHRARYNDLSRQVALNQTTIPVAPPAGSASPAGELHELACDSAMMTAYRDMIAAYGAKGRSLEDKLGKTAAALAAHNGLPEATAFAGSLFEASQLADSLAQDWSARVEVWESSSRLKGDSLLRARANVRKLQGLAEYAGRMQDILNGAAIPPAGAYSAAAQQDIVMFTTNMAGCVTSLRHIVDVASH